MNVLNGIIIIVAIVAAGTGLLGALYNERLANELHKLLSSKRIKGETLRSCRFWIYVLSFALLALAVWIGYLYL